MKKIRYKRRNKFTTLSVLNDSANKIRKIASKKGITVYALFDELLDNIDKRS